MAQYPDCHPYRIGCLGAIATNVVGVGWSGDLNPAHGPVLGLGVDCDYGSDMGAFWPARSEAQVIAPAETFAMMDTVALSPYSLLQPAADDFTWMGSGWSGADWVGCFQAAYDGSGGYSWPQWVEELQSSPAQQPHGQSFDVLL